MNSAFLKLNWKDLGKAVLVVFLFAALTPIQTMLGEGSFPTLAELGAAALVGLKAGGAYLLKNLFSNSDGEPLKKDA